MHYVKKKTGWSDGEKLRPVDLEGEVRYREVFVHKLLGMSSEELERCWLEPAPPRARSAARVLCAP